MHHKVGAHHAVPLQMAAWFTQEAQFDQVFLFIEDSPLIKTHPPIPTQPTFGYLRRLLRSQFESIQKPLLKPIVGWHKKSFLSLCPLISPTSSTFLKGSFTKVKARLQWEILIMRNMRDKNDPGGFRRK
ncbi:MAG: hypothetical protein KME30_05655 [Iphinoe sp. HA4291-MV1]|jgi:hypothetical protein|nr:hypothetical protein [Iphinoe sp. HA4291-MV1]